MNNYEDKQARKLEAYKRLADKNNNGCIATRERADKISDAIPFGQPILVGHHSEKRHRRDLEKIDYLHHKSIELKDKADYYENKADNILNPKTISSDDPEAIIKINAEITELEARRDKVKNHYVYNDKADYFQEGSKHWRTIELESLTRKIRDRKKRIEQLKAVSKFEQEDKIINGVTLKIDKEDNRVKLFFPSIPSEEIRTKLKRNGFHWSPFNRAWQRMISNQALYEAEQILSEVNNDRQTKK